ncbi:hypothetical protein HYU93_00870 [Candidatus Daviesbacteria bacterium]|nr:hypothetical protein [Candidatus Daviesbacteria bacterium]
MNTFGTKNRINPKNILGGMGFFDETGFEKESAMVSSAVATVASASSQVVSGFFEAAIGLGQNIGGTESKQEANGKFSKGSLNNFNDKARFEQLQQQQTETEKQRAEKDRKTIFFQALKEDQQRAQQAKEKKLEEDEINDIIANLPTEQKNRLLHYQASYKDRSIYQKAELRKKLIEEQKKAEKQQKEAPIPSPAKQPSAMEGAFEGRSGAQGSGTSNLSAQAVG